ncbi:MAG: hypothetical protein KDA42_19180 [Planctomycetales bacterium]|nr:hypothetical protein [Planctomycetales bacterium]
MNYLDLRSDRIRRRTTLTGVARQWIPPIAAVLIVGLTMCANTWTVSRDLASRRIALELECQPLLQLQDEATSLRSEIAALRERENLALALLEEKPILTLVGLVSRAASANRQAVYIEEMHYLRNEEIEIASEGTTTPCSVALKGMGENHLAVARFVAALRDTQVFSNVELGASGRTSRGPQDARSFELRCDL